MHLENVVFDAHDPQTLGRFWEAALGTEMLTDEPAGYETRLEVPDGPVLDLCFQQVPAPPVGPQRLHLDVRSGAGRHVFVERLVALGATAGATEPRTTLTDPEGNPFSVAEEPVAYAEDGPVVALSLAVADPARDRDFWAWLTGWVPVEGDEHGLRHPSLRGPGLRLVPEAEPKRDAKNRVHLDVRLERGDDPDAVARQIADRGGRELQFGWGDLPWRHFADPSGNEFCVLPSPG